MQRRLNNPRHDPRLPWLLAPLLTALVLIAALPVSARAQPSATRTGAGLQSDWPLFGLNRDNTRYSPLTQVNASNVQKLGMAWGTSLGQFQVLLETYPQVIGHVMYVTTSTDEVIAMDAVTGKTLWTYVPHVDFSLSTGVGGYGVSVNRGVAVSNGKVYELTFDDKLEAISQATGEQAWQSTVADPHQGYYETMAPTVWGGLVFVGGSGSEDGVRGFIAAYDANTGKQVWRFYTVPAPGHGWVPKTGRHGGGTIYMPPTIDTRTGLLYVGTGNPSPVILGTQRQGPDLYTDSILALQARTGKLVWYHQEIAHDLWDYDAESPVVIFDTQVHGKTVHAVAEAGKSGYFFILNAQTGKDLFPPLAFVKEHHTPPTTKGVLECPGAVGGSQYSPVAYNPQVHAAYVSGLNVCEILKVTATHGGESDFGGVQIPVKGRTGTFSAVDVHTGKFLWFKTMPTPMVGGATTTASNIVFTGDQHGTFYAFDARTGKLLWKTKLGLGFGSAPVIYAINGKEYIAVAVGGSALTGSLKLGNVGAAMAVLTLGGKAIKPFSSPGTPSS